MHLAEGAELRQLWMRTEIDRVKRRELRSPQAPRELDLEHRVVPPCLQRPLPPPRPASLDPRLRRREERLELVDGQRAAARVALELVQVRDEVALAEQLPGTAAELPLADRRPGIAPITRVLREPLQPQLVRAEGRARHPLRPRQQILEVLIHMRRPPLPRPTVNMLLKATDDHLVGADRLRLQIARRLLAAPAGQH